MTHILDTSTVHTTASPAYEGNSVYCQSSSAHNIKHIGHLNTDVPARARTRNFFAHDNDALTARPQLCSLYLRERLNRTGDKEILL